MSIGKTSTSQLSTDRNRYASSWWGATLGLVAAVVLVGILYFSFSGNLMEEPATAVPPTAAPTSTGQKTPAITPGSSTK